MIRAVNISERGLGKLSEVIVSNEIVSAVSASCESMYLMDPAEAQVRAVEVHTGVLQERELYDFFDEVRENVRQTEGYEGLKYYYSKDRIIAGTSWAWG